MCIVSSTGTSLDRRKHSKSSSITAHDFFADSLRYGTVRYGVKQLANTFTCVTTFARSRKSIVRPCKSCKGNKGTSLFFFSPSNFFSSMFLPGLRETETVKAIEEKSVRDVERTSVREDGAIASPANVNGKACARLGKEIALFMKNLSPILLF